MATITYTLSTTGQKASILASGDGKAQQTVAVERDDPNFARFLARASIGSDGSATLAVGYTHYFDTPQTVISILDFLDAVDAAKVAEARKVAESRKVETAEVLVARRTRKHCEVVGVNRDGSCCTTYNKFVSAEHRWESADWPYQADSTVKSSPAAVAWEAELESAKVAALEVALDEARSKLPALLAAEKAAEEAKAKKAEELAAAKVAMGGLATDYRCRVEDGAIQNIPLSRGNKSWFATITVSPSSPGGLARDFAPKARGGAYYMVPSLSVGDPVEFGEDSISRRGKRTTDRWYGFVVAVTPDAILLRQCGTGKEACKTGAKFAQSLTAK